MYNNDKPISKESQTKVMRFELSPSTIITIVLLVAGFWLLIKLVPVILLLVTSLILVEALVPVVKWIENQGIRRGFAIGIVFTLLLVITVAFISLTIPELIAQIKSFVDHEPALRARLITWLDHSKLTFPLAESLRNFKFAKLFGSSTDTAIEFSTRIFEIFAYSVGIIFLAFYIMLDRDRLRGGLFSVVPRSHHIRLSRVMINLETIVGGYIRGQVLTCFLLAAFIFILLWFAGVPNALAFALFGSIVDVLPYIGILLSIVPVVLAALTKGTFVAIIVFVLMFIYEEFEGRILIPIIYGRALRLPSSVILFSLFTGTALMGMVGALLSIPVAAAIRMLIIELRVDLPGQTEQSENIEIKKTDIRIEKEYEIRTEGMPAEQAAAIAVEISEERKKEEDSTTTES